MSYRYEDIRPQLFTEKGSVTFTEIRDRVHQMLSATGAFQMEKAWVGVYGDDWLRLACVDRLVELGEIREVMQLGVVAGQHRVFVKRG